MTGPEEILTGLFDSAANSSTSRGAMITHDEAKRWPEGMIAQLVAAKLIKPSTMAENVICYGCSQQCYRPVVAIPSGRKREKRYYINCDQMPEVAPMVVLPRNLTRHRVSSFQFAGFIANEMGFDTPSQPDKNGKINLGTINGRHGRRRIFFETKYEIALKVGAAVVCLSDVVRWHNGMLFFDRDVMQAYIGVPMAMSAEKPYMADTTRREASKILTRRRYQKWALEAQRIHREKPQLTKSAISKIIAKLPMGEGRAAGTIIKFI